MKDVSEKAVKVETSQKDFNSKLHFLRVKAGQERALTPNYKVIKLPDRMEMVAERIWKNSIPEAKPLPRKPVMPPGIGYHPPNGEYMEAANVYKPYSLLPSLEIPWPRTFYPCFAFLTTKAMYPSRTTEMHRGSVYFDVAADSDVIPLNAIQDMVTLPHNLSKDHYPTYYESPDYIHDMVEQRGLRTYRLKGMQDLVFVLSKQDGALYVFRRKDLGRNGKMAKYAYRDKQGRYQGPNCPIRLSYTPNEIWAYESMPSGHFCRLLVKDGRTVPTATCKPDMILRETSQWHKVGQIAEDQGMAKIGYGPVVQMGKLDTVPYFDDEPIDYDCISGSDNFRMIEA